MVLSLLPVSGERLGPHGLPPDVKIMPETAFRVILGNPRACGGLDYRLASLPVYELELYVGLQSVGDFFYVVVIEIASLDLMAEVLGAYSCLYGYLP